jgi:hypothetical protein
MSEIEECYTLILQEEFGRYRFKTFDVKDPRIIYKFYASNAQIRRQINDTDEFPDTNDTDAPSGER